MLDDLGGNEALEAVPLGDKVLILEHAEQDKHGLNVHVFNITAQSGCIVVHHVCHCKAAEGKGVLEPERLRKHKNMTTTLLTILPSVRSWIL